MKNNQETIVLEAGEKIELFNRRFSSVPMNYEFIAKPLGPKPLTGMLEVHSKKMVFSSPIKTISLKSSNTVRASMWDTFMTIYVVAGCDMEISFPKRKITSMKRVFVLVSLLVVAAVVMLFVR